jgi:hypothetical protein
MSQQVNTLSKECNICINQIKWTDLLLPAVSLNKKDIKEYTFLELVSLIVNTFRTVHTENNNTIWSEFWLDFESQLIEQNKIGWPEFILIKKQYSNSQHDATRKNNATDDCGQYSSSNSRHLKHKLVALMRPMGSFSKHTGFIGTGSSFNVSNNILIMLLRIVYTEKYKESNTFQSTKDAFKSTDLGEYSGINPLPTNKSFLQYVLNKKETKELNSEMYSGLDNIELAFTVLKKHISKYISVYNDDTEFEYQLGKFILGLFDE